MADAQVEDEEESTTSEAPTPKELSPEQAMPTVAQLCEQYELNDVDLEYSKADYSNLTTYKLFLQTFRWTEGTPAKLKPRGF